MIADIKPYPAMKNSGVPWLGEVPEHWEVRKLRDTLQSVTERNRPDLPLLSVVREKGVILRDISSKEANHNFIPDDLTNYKVVRKGQFAMNKMKAWQGSYGISRYDGIVSPAYYVFDLDGVDDKFFSTAIRSKAYVPYFTQASDGVRIGQWDLSQSRMREIPFSVPPAPEQDAIVQFINYVDRRIRRYMRAKQKLIKLLEEQKQAIIHQAVTGQIDVRTGKPYPAYKSSGTCLRADTHRQIEWLSDVPEHWEPLRSWRLFSTRKELALSDDVQLSATQAYGVIPQAEFERRVGRRVTKIFMHLDKRKHVERDDFVMSMRSFQGGLERAWASGAIRSSYVILKPDGRANVDFFMHVFKSRGYIGALQATANFIRDGQDLTEWNFRQVDLPCPPLEEQAEIASHVSATSARLRSEVARANREIELLNEYLTRLIADVVTGKLDVREAAATLPDEPEESNATDNLNELLSAERQDEPVEALEA